ncbi:uncharacterized protein PHACADRAFT_85419 [Phanerochaete carnosa HHB-10118-sp]|uniref:Erythromycin esterase n=1 Tax=Phanerochaete carnosa (strain HHB-10118-sp) TaxID=650164 RepID=K5WNY9_PHACS|nr:uncharacterized protein PHACADRAFT_85419 [Phanerochaete carnosa HHB-10118-sp]EKM60919.1 hypothetical protein PHACADRAFT_85419 [Phanerochaete carnosa HHB-10118-sp]
MLKRSLRPLAFARSAYDPMVRAVGNAQIVLIGDGSHGTYEFYAHRANITQRLIEEKGFVAVAVEADWPDAFRINRYIHGGDLKGQGVKNARDAMKDFERFPKWMWKNEVMPGFVQYLRHRNDSVMQKAGDYSAKVSFFGLDLYSLHRSAEEVLRYLNRIDPEGARAARKRYNCFERFGEDTTHYALEAQFGLAKTCHKEVIQNLQSLLRNHQRYIEEQLSIQERGIGTHPAEEQFVAEMNALLVKDAEEYYRTMMEEDTVSWNLSTALARDDHFARVVVDIAHHLGRRNADAKIVVWAHNSHIGDARATDMGRRRGEINIGQRCREIFGGDNVFNLGFLTGNGTVTAAYNWDEPARLMAMNPPLQGSIEQILNDAADTDAFLVMNEVHGEDVGKTKKVEVSPDLSDFLNRPRYQRFIGVIHRKMTEIPSHYSRCSLADQYDAVAVLKQSRGIQPLEREDIWKGYHKGEIDETFPFGY